MPELPEVETIRRQLEREVVGKKVKSADVLGNRTVRRQTKKEFSTRLEGAKITAVRRKGKFINLAFDNTELLYIHLRMSGQLRRAANKDPIEKHTHVVLAFTQHGQLRYIDPRTFGELFVTSAATIEEDAPDVVGLGVDPVEEPMSWTDFGRLARSHNMKLKAFLTDQTIVAGIGNIYSDEILHAAGLRYDRMTKSLSTMEIRRFYRALVETLHDAIKHRGSTLADQSYLDLHGKPGDYAQFHQVYARDKQACKRCRGTVAKARFAQRSTYFCPDCQV